MAILTKIAGWAEVGGATVATQGLASTTTVEKSLSLATVTIYGAGTVTLATIYSDATGTPQANPFTVSATGYWSFYIETGTHVDVKFSGSGVASPFTLGDMVAPASSTVVANVRAFGAKGDVRVSQVANMSASSAVLTCADAAFSATDIGKAIDVNSAGAQGDLYAIITAVTNSTTVTINTAASFTLVGATLTIRGATYTCNTTLGSTTVTSAGAGFSAAFDIGRPILIANAGRYNKVGTIVSVTNSTTATLSFTATGAVTNKQAVWATNDTAAIRAAYAAADVTYFPAPISPAVGYAVSTFSGASHLGFKGAILVSTPNKSFVGDSEAVPSVYAIGAVGSDLSTFNAAIVLITPASDTSTAPLRTNFRYINFLGTNALGQAPTSGTYAADGVIIDGGPALPVKPDFVSLFEYCTFSHHWDIGWHHFGPGRSSVSYCEAHYNAFDGFNPTNIDGNDMDHCRATYNGGGFEESGGNSRITNCYAAYNRNGGLNTGGFGDPDLALDCQVSGNQIINNGGTGLVVGSNLQNVIITDNIIRQNELAGMIVQNGFGTIGKRGQIKNNIIYSNGTTAFATGIGLSFNGAIDWDVEGNIIKDLGLSGYQQTTGMGITNSTGLRILRNNVQDHPAHDYASSGSTFQFLDENDADISFATSTVSYVNTTMGTVQASFLPYASAGSAVFGLDSSGGTSIILANNATSTPFGNLNNFGGMLMVSESATFGALAMFLTTQGVIVEVGDVTGKFTTTLDNATTINVYLVSGVVTIQNKTGSSVTLRVGAYRMRVANF